MLNANPIRELANNFLGLTVRQRDRVFASMILPSPGAPDSASTSVGVSQGAAKGGRETMCLQTLLKTDRREFYLSPLYITPPLPMALEHRSSQNTFPASLLAVSTSPTLQKMLLPALAEACYSSQKTYQLVLSKFVISLRQAHTIDMVTTLDPPYLCHLPLLSLSLSSCVQYSLS